MRNTIRNGLAVIALVVVAGSASAQAPQPHQRPGADRTVTRAAFVDARIARLTALDGDGDGVVSVEERRAGFQAKRAERMNARFARLDANGDGSISRAEFDAASRSEHAPRAEQAGHRGGRRHALRAHGGRTDQAGPVTIADVRARLTAGFDKLDTDHDGVISAEERRAAAAERREQRRERMSVRRQQQPASTAPTSE